jgi:hypothetical protein
MVAAQHEWYASSRESLGDEAREAIAGGGDLRQVLGARMALRGSLGLIDRNIAEVLDRIAQGLDALVEAGDAKSGGSHIDAAAALAEIEGSADDGYVGGRHGGISPPRRRDAEEEENQRQDLRAPRKPR